MEQPVVTGGLVVASPAMEQPVVTGGLVVASPAENAHVSVHVEDAVQEEISTRRAASSSFAGSGRLKSSKSIRIKDSEYREYDRGDCPPSFLIKHILSSMHKSQNRVRDCRRLFLSLQSKTVLWSLIEDLNSELSDDPAQRRAEQAELLELHKNKTPPANEMQRRAKTLLDFLKDRADDNSGFFFHPSPAGDVPLHLFYLLGVSEICRDVIETVYVGKSWQPAPNLGEEECINIPFKSNLRWLASESVPDPADATLSSSFTNRLPSLTRSSSFRQTRQTSLKDFVGFDRTLRSWEKNGWIPDKEQWHDMGLYTGETVLHIAIVNQDVEEVAMLLQAAGADVRARATGAFFQPPLVTPFKSGARVKFASIRKQLAFMLLAGGCTMLKNERSGFYGGEFPLSFAASVGNVEILELVLEQAGTEEEKAGLVVAADSFGNTALHMAAYHSRPAAFDWLIAHGARPCLTHLNLMGLTPFTVTAFVGNPDLMLHILRKHMARPLFEFGEMRSIEVEMSQVDSFRIEEVGERAGASGGAGVRREGSSGGGGVGNVTTHYRKWSCGRQLGAGAGVVVPEGADAAKRDALPLHAAARMQADESWRSAIEIIVAHQVEVMTSSEYPEAAQLVKRLIDCKWRRFAGARHWWRRAIPFMALVLVFSFLFVWRCSVLRQHRAVQDGLDPAGWTAGREKEVWGMEAGLVGVSVPWLLYSGLINLKLELSSLDVNMDGDYATDEIIIFLYKNMQAAGDFSAVGCVLVCGVCRLADAPDLELTFYTFLVVVLWANVMSLLLPSPTFGSLTFMIYRMLVGDIFKFLVIYLLLLLGFGLALFGLLQGGDFPRDLHDQGDLDCIQCNVYFGTLVKKLVYVSMGEVEQSALLTHMRLPALATFLYILYSVLSLLLLLNLIIAMMGDTYLKTSQRAERDWFWPYASLVLQYEREMSKAQRERHRLGLSSETETEQGQSSYHPFVYYRETTSRGTEQPHILI